MSQAAVTPQDAWGLTFYDRGKCRELIAQYRSEGIFTPPSLQGTILSPGYVGGVNWGSLAFDSERQLVIAAVNHVPMVVTLVPRDQFDRDAALGRVPGFGVRTHRPARPTACAASCWPRRSACRARRRRGERSPPSTCGATRSAGR